MDVLSDTLRVVRLAGAVFFTARMAGPWAVTSPPGRDLAGSLGLPAECVTYFHVLIEGHCFVALPDHPPIPLGAGDVVILPHGAAHIMANDARVAPVPLTALVPPLTSERIPELVAGTAGDVSRLICGYLHCDQRFNPLMGALPEVIVVSNSAPEARRQSIGNGARPNGRVVVMPSGEWLATTLRYTIDEANGAGPGNAMMMGRLAEILFVEVLRRYMRELPDTQLGWLAGVKDPIVGQALHLLHSEPERDWTVEELARALAVSRSTLADSFTALIGEPPIRYLALWRMQLARQLLRQTTLSVGAVAGRVGFTSEAAFNRAFKRHAGQPPALWRLSEA
ncbi:MAG TPA: AraC family transcriptional regulator [Ktedonobacterales bacterium]|nr:AraC family transcriptional regulator [Ktedonobacterales bacterium]